MRRPAPGTTAPFAVLLALCTLCTIADRASAQGSTNGASGAVTAAPPPLPAADSIFRRARRLVTDGNGAAGRALVDSMLRASAEGTPGYGDALFWRGALSETAADAERDYRRVIVEYPLSPYSDDALLSLAELEQARGDRTAAYQHLQRFVREHPVSPARARAGLAAARLAFEQRDSARGCAMIADARTSAASGDVELRNQIDYYGSHCPTVAATAAPTASEPPRGATASTEAPAHASAPRVTKQNVPASTTAHEPLASTAIARDAAPVPKPRKTEPAADGARGGASASHGTWTIQLAAYNTRPEAEHMLAKLKGRGVNARISGTVKPFRVRLDYYPTRQAAATAVAALKQRGIIGFATEEPRATGAEHR